MDASGIIIHDSLRSIFAYLSKGSNGYSDDQKYDERVGYLIIFLGCFGRLSEKLVRFSDQQIPTLESGY